MVAKRYKKKTVKRRSGFEDDFESLLKVKKIKYEYEPKDKVLTYNIPESFHKYHPDFVVKDVIFETKGLWDLADRAKILHLKRCHPDKRIVMVFQYPNQKIYKGSPTSYAKWCEKNGIEWCTLKTLDTKLSTIAK